MIRFATRDGRTVIHAMNGAILGSGEWLGRVPDGTVATWISPTSRPGPWSFRIDSVESVPRWRIAAQAAQKNPGALAHAIGARLINARSESYQLLQFAGIAPTPFKQYASWHRRLARAAEIGGFDRPYSTWDRSPAVRLLVSTSGDAARLAETVASLRSQIYPRWTLDAVSSADDKARRVLDRLSDDERRVSVSDRDHHDFDDNDLVAVVDAGDLLPEYSLGCIVEMFARHEHLEAIYGDEDSITTAGRLHSPCLRFDWSPALERSKPYVGRLTCIRYATLSKLGIKSVGDILDFENSRLSGALLRLAPHAVGHVRRVVYRRRREIENAADTVLHISTAPRRNVMPEPPSWPPVSIIIPTRDRADLLRECVRGLRERTDYPSYEVIIVDNGTVAEDALRLLNELKSDPRFRVLERPGPFNYAALCNDGVRSASSPMLVFLNNDVEMIDNSWLKPLVAWAMKPNVGVVGAKLLFPDGTIQHAGVVMGLGGICGHIYKGRPGHEPGYLNELDSPHEMTAVTGACIAIERHKFDAIGGFDAENLPVDLNDIDLCLRTSERGWTNMWTPQSVLTHRESASRGFEFKPFNIYRKERTYFVRRWAHRIGDDPFFHPALSLYTHQPSLA